MSQIRIADGPNYVAVSMDLSDHGYRVQIEVGNDRLGSQSVVLSSTLAAQSIMDALRCITREVQRRNERLELLRGVGQVAPVVCIVEGR